MILTNKKTLYNVNNSNELVKLSGNISFNEDDFIESFNGSFSSVGTDTSPEENLGGFNYNEEVESGTVNKSIYGVPFSREESLVSLLNDTITKIKTEVSTDIITE